MIIELKEGEKLFPLGFTFYVDGEGRPILTFPEILSNEDQAILIQWSNYMIDKQNKKNKSDDLYKPKSVWKEILSRIFKQRFPLCPSGNSRSEFEEWRKQ